MSEQRTRRCSTPAYGRKWRNCSWGPRWNNSRRTCPGCCCTRREGHGLQAVQAVEDSRGFEPYQRQVRASKPDRRHHGRCRRRPGSAASDCNDIVDHDLSASATEPLATSDVASRRASPRSARKLLHRRSSRSRAGAVRPHRLSSEDLRLGQGRAGSQERGGAARRRSRRTSASRSLRRSTLAACLRCFRSRPTTSCLRPPVTRRNTTGPWSASGPWWRTRMQRCPGRRRDPG